MIYEDPLAPAKGTMNALLLGVGFWGLVILGFVAWHFWGHK